MATTSDSFGVEVPAPRRGPAGRRPGLLGETSAALARSLLLRVKSLWRQSPLYRLSLTGPMPDRIVVAPDDLRVRRLEEADAILRGRYRLAGGLVTVKDASPWDAVAPNETWAEELHGFGWLRHLAQAGGEAASSLIQISVAEWLARFAHGHPIGWRPHVTARRLTAFAAHSRLIFGSDVLWRSKVLRAMAQQARHLQRSAEEAPDGEPRLTAAIGLALSGVTLPDGFERLERGLALTGQELARQILPDGGHVSRSPEALLNILLDLLTLADALRLQGRATPAVVQHAVDRMAPMLRFFRHGDGRLALFNGGSEGAERAIEAALMRDDAKGRPFGYAPQSGYQRLSGGETVVIMDAGGPPPGAFSGRAHAGALSFEMSAGEDRVVVNCGTTLLRGPEWREVCRRTVAHSTLSLDDQCSARTLSEGWRARLLGARLHQEGEVVSRRKDDDSHIIVESRHSGYARSHGLVHERMVTLTRDGGTLYGLDTLVPPHHARRSPRPGQFAVRFHIHPDVRLSLAQDGASVLLRTAAGRGFRFRAQGGALTIAESVYLGDGAAVRRGEQIVVSGEAGETTRIDWSLKAIAAE